MKKIYYIWIVTFILISTIIFAEEPNLCTQTIKENETCLFMTPIVTGCDNYNFTVKNSTGVITQDSAMNPIGGNLYNFNFSEERGEYVVILCDGTTREIEVKGDNMLTDVTIVLILLIIGFIFLGIGHFTDNLVWNIFGSIWFFAAAPLLANTLLKLSPIFIWLSIGFFWLIAIVMMYMAVEQALENRKEKEEDD